MPKTRTRIHTHQPVRTRLVSIRFFGCVRPGDCTPEAHGGDLICDVCSCGATRLTNINYPHRESSGWKRDEAGAA